jgi:hypothetical protein
MTTNKIEEHKPTTTRSLTKALELDIQWTPYWWHWDNIALWATYWFAMFLKFLNGR